MIPENIYPILAKHFLALTNADEESIIAKFKSEQPKEYQILKNLFKEKRVFIRNYDSAKAWRSVSQKFESRSKTKILPIHRYFLRIAAAITFILVAAVGIYYYTTKPAFQETLSTIVQTEEKQRITLSDGSVVWLNRGSSLSYPEQFKGDMRQVKLQGEAFFEIVKNPKKPFIITSGDASIKVLGTSFNVNSRDQKVEVSVATGIVQVASILSKEEVIIEKGYTASVINHQVKSFNTINNNFAAWNTGIFKFNNTPIATVIHELNSYYNNKIELVSPLECTLTASFNRSKLDEVLEIIKLTCGATITEKGNAFVISN
jgi:transmembrane sensor